MSNGTKNSEIWGMFDPLGVFRQMRDTYLENTGSAMVDLVNTEEYAQAAGAILSMYLDLAEPVRAWMEKGMPHVLGFYGLPSRKELLSVAARANRIEMQLDDIQSSLEEIRQMLHDQELERGGRLGRTTSLAAA